MPVEVVIPQFLQHLTGNVKTAEVTGDTVGLCLEELIRKFPELEDKVFDKEGNIPGLLNVYINKKSAFPGELDKPVGDGDKIYIAYTLVGG